MNAAKDPLILVLNEVVHTDAAAATMREALRRVTQELDASTKLMAWEVVPLSAFGDELPPSIRSCWIFAIRALAATGAERHPNSHQRSLSLIGSGTFELRDGSTWRSQPLTSREGDSVERRWVSIPPSTWHRLVVGPEPWGMISFHTVDAADLIEEKPLDANNLDGETHQERYAGRR
jgi:hypothetical protein